MASSSASQVPSAALDVAGMTALTATRSAADARLGAIYDPQQWAAAAPVHLHPMADGRYLLLASQRWYSGTQAPTDVRGYTAHTVSTQPSWIMINPTGHVDPVTSDYTIPMMTANSSRTLVAAASKGPTLLYTLNQVLNGSEPSAVVQFIYMNILGRPQLRTEETIPSTSTVAFDAGMYVFDTYLYVFGTDLSGACYLARKPVAQIGNTAAVTPSQGTGQSISPATSNPTWEYQTDTGFSRTITDATPIATESGILHTAGPISAVNLRQQIMLSTVTDATHSNIWASRGPHDPWRNIGATNIPDASTGALRFVPTLAPVSVSTGNKTSIPFVRSAVSNVGGVSFIDVVWQTWDVPS